MILCKGCDKLLPEEEFYAGIRTYCKPCWRARVKANREAKLEQYQAYDRARANLPHRVAAREAYADTPAGRAAKAAAKKAWADRNPEKRAAHIALGNVVRDGKVIKPAMCSRCPSTGPLHGHHSDYSKPLEVEWLCDPCHKAEHRELEAAQ